MAPTTLRRLALLLVLVPSLAGCHLFRRSVDDGPLAIEMIRIPGGTFMMGDVFDGLNEDALPVHPVRVKSFKLARYEVTYDQYDAFAEAVARCRPIMGAVEVGVPLPASRGMMPVHSAPIEAIGCRRRRNGNMPPEVEDTSHTLSFMLQVFVAPALHQAGGIERGRTLLLSIAGLRIPTRGGASVYRHRTVYRYILL